MLMCVLLCALRCAAASSLLMVQLHSASSDNRTSRLMNCRWDAGHSPVLWAVARPPPSGPEVVPPPSAGGSVVIALL